MTTFTAPIRTDTDALFAHLEDIATEILSVLLELDRGRIDWATEDAHAALTRTKLLMLAL